MSDIYVILSAVDALFTCLFASISVLILSTSRMLIWSKTYSQISNLLRSRTLILGMKKELSIKDFENILLGKKMKN